jgi:hypothetical protein
VLEPSWVPFLLLRVTTMQKIPRAKEVLTTRAFIHFFWHLMAISLVPPLPVQRIDAFLILQSRDEFRSNFDLADRCAETDQVIV